MSRVEIYKAPSSSETRRAAGQLDWFWRFISNGHIMADGGSYSRRVDCLTGCAKVLGAIQVHSNGPSGVALRRVMGLGAWVSVIDLTKGGAR